MANIKLSQITSGGAFVPSTDVFVTVRGGTTDLLTTLSPGMVIGSGGFTTTGGTFVQYTTNINNFSELSIQNTNSGSSASSDFVATADDGSDTTHYIDMGINNSTGGAAAFTNAHAGYLYVVDNELNIGALGSSGVVNIYATGGIGAPVKAATFTSTQGLTVIGNIAAANFSGSNSGTNTGDQTITSPNSTLTIGGSPTSTIDINLSNANTWTAPITSSYAGTASQGALTLTGVPFSGTGTTSTPLFYSNGGAAPTTWNTSGTYIGVNGQSGFTGNFLEFHVNGGTSLFSVNSGGSMIAAGGNFTGQISTSRNGAASVAPVLVSGSIFTTGTSTTNFPQYLMQPGGASAVITWSTSGTFFGVNSASGFAGNFLDFHVNGGTSSFTLNSAGTPKTISGVATTGLGVPSVYGYARAAAGQTAAATFSTYTVGAADGTFMVSANVLITTSTLHNFTVTCAYTDEGNTSRVLTLQFSNLAGTFITAIANAAGAVPYEGVPLHIRCKAASTITIASAAGGTYTTVIYNGEGCITQIA